MVKGFKNDMVSKSRERIHKESLRALFTILCGLLAGIILCSHTAYAADENIPSDLGIEGSVSDPSIPISAEDDYILRESSKQIADIVYSSSDVRATDYAQLIYNYLVNTIHSDLTNIGTRQNTTNTRLNNILSCLNGNSSTNTYLYDVIYDLKRYTVGLDTSGQSVSIYAMLLAICDAWNIGDAGLNNGFLASTLTSISTNSGGTVLAINGLSNKLDQLNTLSYTDVTSYFQLLGISETFDGTYTLPSSNTTLDAMYLKIHVSGTVNTFNGLKIRLPISYPYNQIRTIKMYVKYIDEQIEVPIEYLVNMNTVYILDCPDTFATADIYLYVDANPQPARITYSPSASVSLKVEICSDSVSQKDYYADLALLDINRKISALDIIKNEIASPDLVQAKEESAPTTKQALDDFTGDGSSAVTPSDVSSASDISDTVSEGVDAGGAVSDALTVFSSASDIYMWFSQDNKNYFVPLDVNYQGYYNPSTDSSLPVYIDYATHELVINVVHYPLYPSPVRGSIRGGKSNDDIQWTDDVPDVLTYYNQQVQSQIGDDK